MASRARGLVDPGRGSRPVRYVALGLLILGAVVVSAFLEGDLPDVARIGVRGMRQFLNAYTYLAGFALLYVEESGIPLPAPGDVFVLFVGAHIPRTIVAFLAAWLGLIAAVVLGATNLFFISRKYGRRLAESRVAEFVHLSPERLERAERWFKRYGVLAIIFGRHIPGFRVPITVAAGVFRVHYATFAASVAVSTAIWAGVVLLIGINYGGRLEHFLQLHSYMYVVWGAIIVGLIALHFASRRMRRNGAHLVVKSTAR